jgi:hypothetical protein
MCSLCYTGVQEPARVAITEARMIDPPCYEKCADSAESVAEMR